MSTQEMIGKEIAALPEPLQREVYDFAVFLRQTAGDEAFFRRHRKRYGYRRIGSELSDHGVVCAPARIRRIMAGERLASYSAKNLRA